MADLPTNLKDDILDSSVNTRRKYRMIENEDGTVEFEDVTEYSQVGDEYGAGLINETNKQVNAKVEKAVIVRDLKTIGAITEEGYIPDALALKDVNASLGGLDIRYNSETGKPEWKERGADTFNPFSGGGVKEIITNLANYTVTSDCTMAIFVAVGYRQSASDPKWSSWTRNILLSGTQIGGVTASISSGSASSSTTNCNCIVTEVKEGDVITVSDSKSNVSSSQQQGFLYGVILG